MRPDPLTREIIVKFLANLGVAPKPNFGKVGITTSEFKTSINIETEWEDQVSLCPIWAGQIEEAKLRAAVVDLSTELPEFALVLKVEDKPMYGLRLSYDEIDYGLFVITSAQGWIIPDIRVKLRALLGTEDIVQQGILWKPCSQVEDLVEGLQQIMEIMPAGEDD